MGFKVNDGTKGNNKDIKKVGEIFTLCVKATIKILKSCIYLNSKYSQWFDLINKVIEFYFMEQKRKKNCYL